MKIGVYFECFGISKEINGWSRESKRESSSNEVVWGWEIDYVSFYFG